MLNDVQIVKVVHNIKRTETCVWVTPVIAPKLCTGSEEYLQITGGLLLWDMLLLLSCEHEQVLFSNRSCFVAMPLKFNLWKINNKCVFSLFSGDTLFKWSSIQGILCLSGPFLNRSYLPETLSSSNPLFKWPTLSSRALLKQCHLQGTLSLSELLFKWTLFKQPSCQGTLCSSKLIFEGHSL